MAKQQKKSPTIPVIQETAPEVANATSGAVSFLERPFVPQLLLVLAAVLVYIGSVNNELVFFDDDKAILYNHALKKPSFSSFFTGQNLGMYAPMTWIFYWIGSLLSGQEAWGYHLLALLLHTFNGVLVFQVLRTLLPDRLWLSFFAALLFAVHPIQVEAVSWAAALSTVLFATFYLSSWATYQFYVRSVESDRPTLLWLAGSLGLFVLACLSKSAAVTLPLVLVATDYLFNQKQIGKLWTSKILYFLLALAFGLYTFYTREAEGHDIEATSKAFSGLDRFFMISQTLLFYPFKILSALGFTISYPFVKEGGSWNITYYLAPVALLALGGLVWWKARQQKDVLFAISLYLLPLVVMLPFKTVGSLELRSDRYMYISCIGIFLLIGLLIEQLPQLYRYILTGILAVVLGFLAQNQTTVWKDGVALFSNCVAYTPESSLCQCNLAYNQLIHNKYDQAAIHYTEALRTDPNTIEAYSGRGNAYFQLGKIPEAFSDFTKAIQSGLSSPLLHLNRGKCLVMMKRGPEAIPDLTKSIELEKKNPEAYFFRGSVQDKSGNSESALSDYNEAVRLNPDYGEARVNRGVIKFNQKDYQGALEDYTFALQKYPNQPVILCNRANTYLMLGEADKALADVNKVLETNPTYPKALEIKANLTAK